MFQAPTTTPTPLPASVRLAKPTLPAAPSQADHGSQVYWLYCLPCHGDRGQGLTDDFRTTYPPEDRNCWNSGCHGRRPYRNGWTLPPKVPALIGAGALAKFPTAVELHAYMAAAMPFQTPGKMDPDLYWQATAFLLRANGLWDGQGVVDETNAASIKVGRTSPATAQPVLPAARASSAATLVIALLGVLIFVIIIVSSWIARSRPPSE